MGISIGTNSIGSAFIGTSEVNKIYLGDIEVYSKASAASITLEVQAASGMEGYGSLDIQYNSQDASYWDGTELTPPDTNLTLNFVDGAQMVITYNCRYGYCRIYKNGTLIHDTAGSPYTITPNVGDTIKVEFYWED